MTNATHTTSFSWPFYRSVTERMFAGVAGGVAAWLGIGAIYVRAAFVTASLAGGVGLAAYVLAALIVPADPTLSKPSRAPLGASKKQALGLAFMFTAGMLLLETSGVWFGPVVWPATLVIFGLAMAIETSGVNYERSLAGVTSGRRSWWLVVAGLAMMVAGLVVVLNSLEALQSIGVLAIALLVAVGGFFIVAGPWMWSLIEDLRTERRARIRSEEKAEMAAHLHDSVLQTLALIQRSDDPKKMVTLARSQERELRSWLFDERSSDVQTLHGALSEAAMRVEEAHDVPVSVVVVGEGRLPTNKHDALIAAASEAMTNAATHSDAGKVSVYAELGDVHTEVFITDQGQGFDTEAVDEDRKGIAESITARMHRHGGSATIDSQVGEGTEVHLIMNGISQ